jgi:hypothetical protein
VKHEYAHRGKRPYADKGFWLDLELIKFDKSDLGLIPGMTYALYDIWGKRTITDAEHFIFEIPADDVVFIRYKGLPVSSGVR